MKEQVNHPSHYNQHPNGIECIEIIRHYACDSANTIKYLWRAGLKPEMGKDDAEKELEDLKKSLWYIADCRNVSYRRLIATPDNALYKLSGYRIDDVLVGYNEHVENAIANMLRVGVVYNHSVCAVKDWQACVDEAERSVRKRILEIENGLLEKEIQKTAAAVKGYAVDGEDYVSTPGCKRETEPKDYDPLNMIVISGRAYGLSSEVRKKKNGSLYSPCDNCSFKSCCLSEDGTTVMRNLCQLHGAGDNEYYKEVGAARYSPSFGIIEVVDEKVERELELRKEQERSSLDNR